MEFKYKKRKILFVSEASFAATGYGRYYSELINRCYNSGKYRVAEFASFCACGDPRDEKIKWRFYANEPSANDQIGHKLYQSNDSNKTGAWRFDKVLIDFQPDIVVDLRDSTMAEYEVMSPLRKFFFHAISPSLDSAPQIDSWIAYMMQADAVVGYSNYAMDVMRDESGGKIKLYKSAYPGVNNQVFRPIKDRARLKEALGLNPDTYITAMCGRNQIRKLIPELMKAYSLFLQKIKNIDLNLYNLSYLYLHTTLPDLRTWNISKLLVELGLTNKVLFSYQCTKCGIFFPNKFQEVNTTCKSCGGQAILPRITVPLHEENLNRIYNISDLYIQYANAGATEFPLVEAAAAGCNVMAVDWAGTGDACKRLGGIPLKVIGTPRDINVDADRAIPDNEYLADELVKFYKRPRQINLRNGQKISQNAIKKFSWDKNAEIWMELFDSVKLTGYQGKWSADIPFNPQQNLSQNLPTYDWVYNFINLVLQEPSIKHSLTIDEAIKFAEQGSRSTGNNVIPWGRKELTQMLENLVNNKITVEQIRRGQPLNKEDWLEYADFKELVNL